jgi:phosphatidylglycerophosphatase A
MTPPPRSLWREALLTTLGMGHMRPAPGTWGSMPTAGLAGLLLLFSAPVWVYNAALAAVLLLSSAACVALGSWGEARFGRKDASEIVADETAGQCIPLFLLAPIAAPMTPEGFLRLCVIVGAAFVLFRIFDILKPWPAYGLQRLPAGWGVLVDDLVAGLYAAIVLHAGIWLLG